MLHEDYEEIFNSPGGRLISQLEIEDVLSLLDQPSKQLILDVGTGTGRVARCLLKLRNDVVGIDISTDRLKLALKKAKNELEGIINNYHVVVADAHHFPFRTRTFDEIFSIRTLKYLKNPNLSFFEFSRTLKRSGICVVELSNIFGYEAFWLFSLKLSGINHYAQNMGSTYKLFNIFEVKKTLKNLNFTIISTKAWHRIPTFFYIMCKHLVILKILLFMESVLQKILPFFLFSRGILIKFMHSNGY